MSKASFRHKDNSTQLLVLSGGARLLTLTGSGWKLAKRGQKPEPNILRNWKDMGEPESEPC